MNIKEYIASGILEQYVLGMLSEEDSREVTLLLQRHPALQEEVDRIQGALQTYAAKQSPTASSGLENSILNAVNQTPQQDGPYGPSAVAEPKGERAIWKILSLILGFLAIGAIIYALNMRGESGDYKQRLASQQITQADLQSACDEKDRTINQLSDQLSVLLNPDNKKVSLSNPENTTQPLAAVFYNTDAQKAYLNIGKLTAPPEDRFYQLWALVEGQPVDMGEFEITVDGDTTIIEVPYIPNAGAFAITLEPRDGNPAPNLEELQVIGNVS